MLILGVQAVAPESDLCADVHANRHADRAQLQLLLVLRWLLAFLLPALLQQLQHICCSAVCNLGGAASLALGDADSVAKHSPDGLLHARQL